MISDYKRFWGKINPRRKKQLLFIFFLMIFSSVMEVVSIASVVPFLSSFESFEFNKNNSNFFLNLIYKFGNYIGFTNIILLSTCLIVVAIISAGLWSKESASP